MVTEFAAACFVRVAVVCPADSIPRSTPDHQPVHHGQHYAEAVAGLGSATCKMLLVMYCNLDEQTTGDFDPDNHPGIGIKLASVGNGGCVWVLVNSRGYLDPAVAQLALTAFAKTLAGLIRLASGRRRRA